DADQRLAGGDHARAVGPDDAGLAALGEVVVPGGGGVEHRGALGDDHGERDLGVHGLDDRVLGERRRDEEDCHVGTGGLHGPGDATEHGEFDVVTVSVLGGDRGAGLAGVTPPTIWVPAASMRAVCLVPSPPVMPWTMTLLSELRKIDISSGSFSS